MKTLIRNDKAVKGTAWLPIVDLQIDPRSQRDLRQPWVDELYRAFDPEKLGVLHVSKRANGSLFVVDGQHRLAALRKWLGDDANGQQVECKIYEELTIAEEAALFVALNNFLRPTRIDRYLKAVTAKDPIASKIDAIVHEAGFKVDRFSAEKTIPAVGALHAVYTGFSRGRSVKADEHPAVYPTLLRQVLSVITEAWGGSSQSCNGYILEGIGRVLIARGRMVEVDDLSRRLAAHVAGPVGVLAKARGLHEAIGGRLASCVAKHIIDVYNKGRRSGKIDEL